MSYRQNPWQRRQIPFDSQNINRSLQQFNRNQLYDPNYRIKWIEFAKNFSQMSLSNHDISSMSFQNFMALKDIMSVSLSQLSHQTNQQKLELSKYEQELKALDHQMKSLQSIEKQNKQKEKQIKDKIQELKAEKRFLEEQSIFGHSEIHQ